MPEPKNIRFFKNEEAFRKWLEKNHIKKDELWIGYYKKISGKPGITYSQAVNQALCFGWIDGIAKGIDEEKYCQRFTPRRAGSIWSNVNIKKAEALIKNGKMMPEGLRKFNGRDDKKSGIYSFEQKSHKLTPVYQKKFKANKKAWAHFTKMPPWYQRTAIWHVISAKQEATQLRRLGELIADSAKGLRVKHLRPD